MARLAGLSRRHLLLVSDGENTDGYPPDEVAAAIAFLASPAASYINGVNLPVAGGRLQSL